MFAPPPQIPNRYDTDDARLARLERQEAESRRKWWLVLIVGILLLVAYLPLALVGWSGVMLIFAPLGLGMILGAGLSLFSDRDGS